MTFKEVEAKFKSVWKQMEDFIPMGSKEEAERIKRKGINLEQESAKKQKTSEEVTEEAKPPEGVTEEKVKEMMQLVPIEEVYAEALQVKHPIIDWKVYHEGQRSYWKITRVHHVTSKDKEIFMLVEKDYPLRKGLALVMICYKLQAGNFSQMANDLVLKKYKISNSPRQSPKTQFCSVFDSINESNLANHNDNLVDTMPEMFTDKHALDYQSPPLYEEYDDDLDEFEFDNDDAYNDPFDSKGEKIKESKLLIDELDLPRLSDFLPSPEYDSFLFEYFFEVDALPSTDNKDKVFNPGILIQENIFEVNTRVAPDKNVKKIAICHAFLILEDFNPHLYELPFHKEVLGSETLLSFSSKNEEKVFKPEILTSKGVHTSLLPEICHRGPKAFKVTKIIESLMDIFPCFFREDIRILDVPCLYFYPYERLNSGVRSS
nr:hypothetical protein [Tanacetum cinerariifolium]